MSGGYGPKACHGHAGQRSMISNRGSGLSIAMVSIQALPTRTGWWCMQTSVWRSLEARPSSSACNWLSAGGHLPRPGSPTVECMTNRQPQSITRSWGHHRRAGVRASPAGRRDCRAGRIPAPEAGVCRDQRITLRTGVVDQVAGGQQQIERPVVVAEMAIATERFQRVDAEQVCRPVGANSGYP